MMKIDPKTNGWREALQHIDDGRHVCVEVTSVTHGPGRAIVGLRELVALILAQWVTTITLLPSEGCCHCAACMRGGKERTDDE